MCICGAVALACKGKGKALACKGNIQASAGTMQWTRTDIISAPCVRQIPEAEDLPRA